MGVTAHRGFRYPAPTDRVTDGATAIENLAEDVDTVLVNAAKITSGQSVISHAGGNRWFNVAGSLVGPIVLQAYTLDQYGNAVMLKCWAYADTTVYVGNDATPAQSVNGNNVADGTTVYWSVVRAL